MTDNMKKFIEALETNDELKQKLDLPKGTSQEDIQAATIAAAKELGIELTADDFKAEAEGLMNEGEVSA